MNILRSIDQGIQTEMIERNQEQFRTTEGPIIARAILIRY